MQSVNNYKLNEISSITLTVEKAKGLQNEIEEIWKKIGWEETIFGKSSKRYLSEEETSKIICLSKYANSLNASSSNSSLKDLKSFAIESLSRVEFLKVKLMETFKRARSDVYSYSGVSKKIKYYEGLSQSQLFEVAKLAASFEKDFSEHIMNYGIQNQDHIFELAKISASNQGSNISTYIKNYVGLTLEQRCEIAKIAAKTNGCDVSINIKNYGIQDESQLFEIAKIALANKEESFRGYYIEYYGFKNQTYLFEIAKIAAGNIDGFSKTIQEVGIKNEEQLFEVSKIAAGNDKSTSEFIQNYRLQNPEKLFEIAKIAASASKVSIFIQNYKGLTQDHLFEVAKIAAKNDVQGISEHILKYGLNDQQRFEIAKIAAEKDGKNTSKFLENYELKQYAHFVEIAKIAANSNGCSTSQYIQKYGIKEQGLLFEIAKIAVTSKKGEGFSEHFEKYGIQDPAQRVELAILAAKHDGESLAKNIQDFDIQIQSVLVEIATIIATTNPRELLQSIQKFDVQDQTQLVRIAKTAASDYHFSNYIQNFGIKDSEDLFEIAKVAAATNNGGAITSEKIKDYKLTNQAHLIEIAKIAIKTDPESVYYIKNYGIQDPNQRFEIAKLNAQLRGVWISTSIDQYELDSVQHRFEIAKLALLGKHLSYNLIALPYYKLPLEYHVEIFLLASKLAPNEIPEILKGIFKKETDEFSDKEIADFKGLQIMLNPDKTLELDSDSLSLLRPFDQFINKKLPNTSRANLNSWIGFYLLNCQSCAKVSREKFEQFIQNNNCLSVLEAIVKLRSPNRRYQLTGMLFDCFSNNNFGPLKTYNALKRMHPMGQKVTPVFLFLFASLIHQQSAQLEDPENWDTVFSKWKTVFITLASSTYKDAAGQMTVISSLCSLIIDPHLNINEKNQLLLSIFEIGKGIKEKRSRAKMINRNLRFMEGILQAGHSIKLRQFVSLRPQVQSLKIDSLQECLKKIFHEIVGEVNITNFPSKFENTFLKARQPHAFFTYASRLQSLPDNEKTALQPYLRKLYTEILEGNFQQMRYTTSEHLSTIFSWKDRNKELWITNNKKVLSSNSEADEKSQSENSPDIRKYLYDRICQDNHIPSKEFQNLVDYLNDPSPVQFDKSMKNILEKEYDLKILFEPDIAYPSKKQTQVLELEKALLIFLDPSKNTKEKEASLKTARLSVPSQGYQQFLNDLQDLDEMIKGKIQDFEGWTVEDTDAWEDLLLSGTEVLGSCQNIYGDPNYNKCLLSYLLDGKNRIVVLKDTEGHIRARAVLRLLADNTLNRPVLYRERLYSSAGVSKKALDALYEMCTNKAKALGIHLVRTKEENENDITSSFLKSYPASLESLNGIAPFEYVDADHLGRTNGTFTIPAAHTVLLFDPYDDK